MIRTRSGTGEMDETSESTAEPTPEPTPEPTTAHRRRFLKRTTIAMAGASLASTVVAEPDGVPPSWRKPGEPLRNYGVPTADRPDVIRWIASHPSVPGDGVSFTPLHAMAGSLTPNGLHFERHHNGVPTLSADTYRLHLDGLIRRAASLGVDDLNRLPLHSRIAFIECGGNSTALWRPEPMQAQVGQLHGLVSCAEWTGVGLTTLLEAHGGLRAGARWLIADGYDSAGITASLPLDTLPDDTLVALYQNGEPLRPENGYPVRLVIPGWEGVRQVKWLRRLHLADRPAMSRYDTVSYTDRHPDGTATRFSNLMDVKSVIVSPSPGAEPVPIGQVEVRGLAWSGAGSIDRVDISIDGGTRWVPAELQQPVRDRALTAFRVAWHRGPTDAILMSRARDSAGHVQPTRSVLLDTQGPSAFYHYNAITAWGVDRGGRVSHVYA